MSPTPRLLVVPRDGLEPLAEGGMGKVYRAEHALLERPTVGATLAASAAWRWSVLREG